MLKALEGWLNGDWPNVEEIRRSMRSLEKGLQSKNLDEQAQAFEELRQIKALLDQKLPSFSGNRVSSEEQHLLSKIEELF